MKKLETATNSVDDQKKNIPEELTVAREETWNCYELRGRPEGKHIFHMLNDAAEMFSDSAKHLFGIYMLIAIMLYLCIQW